MFSYKYYLYGSTCLIELLIDPLVFNEAYRVAVTSPFWKGEFEDLQDS